MFRKKLRNVKKSLRNKNKRGTCKRNSRRCKKSIKRSTYKPRKTVKKLYQRGGELEPWQLKDLYEILKYDMHVNEKLIPAYMAKFEGLIAEGTPFEQLVSQLTEPDYNGEYMTSEELEEWVGPRPVEYEGQTDNEVDTDTDTD